MFWAFPGTGLGVLEQFLEQNSDLGNSTSIIGVKLLSS